MSLARDVFATWMTGHTQFLRLGSSGDNIIVNTYGFIAKVMETDPDQTKSEKEVPGEIRMLDENGKWLVDGFKRDS